MIRETGSVGDIMNACGDVEKGNVEFFFVVGKPVEKLDVLPSHRGLCVLRVSKCFDLRGKESV